MNKRNKIRKSNVPPQYNPPPMPTVKTNPPNTGSSVQSPRKPCAYETPCGWCTKWDKQCDKKIENNNHAATVEQQNGNTPFAYYTYGDYLREKGEKNESN